MSKLKEIRYFLVSKENNGYLSLMKEYSRRNLLTGPIERDGHLFHVVDFIVAPKQGLYTADELNDLMRDLLRGIRNPDPKNLFKEVGDRLEFGSFTFIEECVAQERNTYKRIIRLNDEELVSNPEGSQCGKKITLKGANHVRLDREINVRPYPDERIAEKYQGKDSISLYDLQGYQKMAEIEKTLVSK